MKHVYKTKGVCAMSISFELEGNVVSNCISSCEAIGNIVVSFSDIGDIARPGNEVNAETDHIPSNTKRETVPFPVLILFILIRFKKQSLNKASGTNVATS